MNELLLNTYSCPSCQKDLIPYALVDDPDEADEDTIVWECSCGAEWQIKEIVSFTNIFLTKDE